MEKQSRLFRIVWKLIQTTNLTQSKINTYLQGCHNIDKRTANTLIQTAKGRLKALRALKDVEMESMLNKISLIEKLTAILRDDIGNLKEYARNNKLTKKQLTKYRGSKRELWQKEQKLNRLKQKVSKLERDLDKPILPLCWGSKKAFKKQYNLEENGFKTHRAWLNWFRKKRDGQINYIGSVGEPHGNQNSQLDYDEKTGLFSIKIRKDLELMTDTGINFLRWKSSPSSINGTN